MRDSSTVSRSLFTSILRALTLSNISFGIVTNHTRHASSILFREGGAKMPRRNPLCFIFPWLPFCRRPHRPHDGRHEGRHDDRHDDRHDGRRDGRYD